MDALHIAAQIVVAVQALVTRCFFPGGADYLGTGSPAKPSTLVPNHNGNFDIDEDVLPLGAALYAAYAMRSRT